MSEFNKVFVNCVGDESLYGKYGYFADNVADLKRVVTTGDLRYWGILSGCSSSNDSFPFVKGRDDLHYRFFYHDPTLYLGMSVSSGKVATYRELSRWLSQGCGEAIYSKFSKAPHLTFTELRYMPEDGNQPVQDIMVRRWADDEWYVPSTSYLGLKYSMED